MTLAKRDFEKIWHDEQYSNLREVFVDDIHLGRETFVGRDIQSGHVDKLFGPEGLVSSVAKELLEEEYQQVPYNPVTESYAPGAKVLFVERAVDNELADDDYHLLQGELRDTRLDYAVQLLRDTACNRKVGVDTVNHRKVPMLDFILIDGKDKSAKQRNFVTQDAQALVRVYMDLKKKLYIEVFGPDQIDVERKKQMQLDERRLLVPQLMSLAEQAEINELQQMLAEHDLPVNVYDAEGNSLLMASIHSGKLPMVQALLGHCPRLADTNNHGDTALIEAVRSGDVAITSLLMDMGADVMIANHDHENALVIAAKLGDVAMVNLLLTHGAQVYQGQEQRDNTALMYAHEHDDAKLLAEVLRAYLVQSYDLDNNSAYDVHTQRLLLLHRDQLYDQVQGQGLSSLSSENRIGLYRKLLHPQHALGRIFWHDHDISSPPEIIGWLEQQILATDIN